MAHTRNPTGAMEGDKKPEEGVEDFSKGPLSVLWHSVKNNTQVLVNVRNNHKLLGRVKAFDRHCNLYVHLLVCV